MKKYLRFTDVMKRYGAGRSTIYDWVNKGICPAPVKLGGTPLFVLEELDQADEKRKLERDQN